MKKLTKEEFIKKAIKIHSYEYDYSEIEYINSQTKIKIICGNHFFYQEANSHLMGQKCPKCSKENFINKNIKTIDMVIEEFKKIHKDRYCYLDVNYIGDKQKVKIKCFKHGYFYKTPNKHKQGQGCVKCTHENLSISQSKTTFQFIEESIKVHENKYDYSKSIYKKNSIKLKIICHKHKEPFIFKQRPLDHLKGNGCPRCCNKISKSEIIWLNLIEQKENIKINRQFYLKNIKVRCDGFCEETNTVYEFYGDYWHGNPNIYNLSDYNKRTKCMYKELYDKTIEKEKRIKEAGYNLITIWENDFNKQQLTKTDQEL